MFERLPEPRAASVAVTIDGTPHIARASDTVAAALLLAGLATFRRSAVSGAPRGPFCMMGACFDCLVTIDGRVNQQGCAVRVREGMRIETQAGAPRVDAGAAPG